MGEVTDSAALASMHIAHKLATAALTLKTKKELRLAVRGMLGQLNAAKHALGDAIDVEFALKARIRLLEKEKGELVRRISQIEHERRRAAARLPFLWADADLGIGSAGHEPPDPVSNGAKRTG